MVTPQKPIQDVYTDDSYTEDQTQYLGTEDDLPQSSSETTKGKKCTISQLLNTNMQIVVLYLHTCQNSFLNEIYLLVFREVQSYITQKQKTDLGSATLVIYCRQTQMKNGRNFVIYES